MAGNGAENESGIVTAALLLLWTYAQHSRQLHQPAPTAFAVRSHQDRPARGP